MDTLFEFKKTKTKTEKHMLPPSLLALLLLPYLPKKSHRMKWQQSSVFQAWEKNLHRHSSVGIVSLPLQPPPFLPQKVHPTTARKGENLSYGTDIGKRHRVETTMTTKRTRHIIALALVGGGDCLSFSFWIFSWTYLQQCTIADDGGGHGQCGWLARATVWTKSQPVWKPTPLETREGPERPTGSVEVL